MHLSLLKVKLLSSGRQHDGPYRRQEGLGEGAGGAPQVRQEHRHQQQVYSTLGWSDFFIGQKRSSNHSWYDFRSPKSKL